MYATYLVTVIVDNALVNFAVKVPQRHVPHDAERAFKACQSFWQSCVPPEFQFFPVGDVKRIYDVVCINGAAPLQGSW